MRISSAAIAILVLFLPCILFAQADLSNNNNKFSSTTIPPEISLKLKQEHPVLTFEDCAEIAIRTSFNIKDAELELKRRNFGYIAKLAGLRSRVDLSMTLPEVIQEQEEKYNYDTQMYEFYSINTNEQNAELTFTQPLATNGEISGSIVANRFDQAGESTEFTNRLDIEFDQPIFSANKLQMDIYSSRLNLEKAKTAYIRSRVTLIYGYGFFNSDRMRRWGSSLSSYYYGMYHAARMRELEQAQYILMEEIVEQSELMMNEGKFPESDYLKLKVELSGSSDRLYSANSKFEESKRQLIQFLGLDPKTDFDVIRDIRYAPVQIDREHAINEGLTNNTGIRDLLIEIEEDSLAIIFEQIREESTETGEVRLSELKGNINSSLGLNKNDSRYRLYYDDFNQSQSFKLSFSAPLWDWGRKEMLVEAKSVNLELRKRQLQNDISDTRRQVIAYIYTIEMMQERIELIRRARDISAHGLDLALKQFKEDAIPAEDLILALNKSYEAKTEYLNLIVDYKNALIRLANQTQWDYEKNKSIRKELETFIESII